MAAGARTRIFGRTWTPEEDRKLLLHVAAHGTRQWRAVVNAGLLPGRDSKACCNRFIVLRRKYFNFQERFQGQFQPLMEMETETPESPLLLQITASTHGSEFDNRSVEAMLADLANNIDTTAHAGAPGIDCDITVSEYASPAPVIEVSATTEYAAMEYGSPGSSTGSVATATPANAVDNPSAAAAAACAATEAEIYNLLLARLHEPGHEATGAHSGTFPVDPPMWHETEHSAVHARTFHTDSTNWAAQEETVPDLQANCFQESEAGRFLEAALLDLISRAAAPLACNQTGSLPAEPARKMREGSSSFMFGVNRLALELGCELQGLQREGLGKQEAGLAMELPGTFPALDDSESVGEWLASFEC